MTNERLQELKQLVLDGLYTDETGDEEVFEHYYTISTTQQADLITLIDSAMKPVSEEVKKAIMHLECMATNMMGAVQNGSPTATSRVDALDLAIRALKQYQPKESD